MDLVVFRKVICKMSEHIRKTKEINMLEGRWLSTLLEYFNPGFLQMPTFRFSPINMTTQGLLSEDRDTKSTCPHADAHAHHPDIPER